MAAMQVSDSPLKKRQRMLTNNQVVIYIVPNKIEATHLGILKNQARSNDYNVQDDFCDEVTHILTELATKEAVEAAMDNYKIHPNIKILSIAWLIASMLEKAPIMEKSRLSTYEIKSEILENKAEYSRRVNSWTAFACKGKALLNHNNQELVDPLDILIRRADHLNDAINPTEGEVNKATEYKLYSAILKSLPFKIEHVHELESLPYISDHINTYMREILEEGESQEVEDIKESVWFKTMELFTGVYGIGSSTAKKFYDYGYRTIDHLVDFSEYSPILSDIKIICGLGFYDDLISMTREDADQILAILQQEFDVLLPGTTVVLAGGFRRGKSEDEGSHFLVAVPKLEATVLYALIDRLQRQNIILCSWILNELETYDSVNEVPLNSFQQCRMVLRCPTGGRKWSQVEDCERNYEIQDYDIVDQYYVISKTPRQWKAVRVELVICEATQFAYALVKLTGSEFFNTCLGMHAKGNSNMILHSNGLWDNAKNVLIPAADEREVFANLKLDYLEPWERNM